MKKFTMVLCSTMMLGMSACGLFADESAVQFEDLYTHNDPDGLTYDERKVLINDNFGTSLEELVNTYAYPDTMKYDEEGNMIGIYDYDAETGMASGWMDLLTGEFFEEETDLGMPEESLMIHLSGTVTLGSVVYGNENKAVCAYLYAFLGDSADKEVVLENIELYYGYTLIEESETVLVCTMDEAAIDAKFQEWQEWYGQISSDRSASVYADNLKLDLGLRYYGVNPYKPCEEISDPEDIAFDEKVILTSNGSYSFVDDSLENNMVGRTDVVYGKDGVVVAHFIYYEYETKDGADKLVAAADGNFFGEVKRVSNTVVADVISGQILEDIINTYIGYNVLSDNSVDGYVTNIEETYFSMQYED